MLHMRRREFIAALGSAAAWPIAARAQQARMPVLGFLGSAAEADYKTTTAAVRSGLNEAGYVEKQNLLIEYRWATFQYDRLPALAAELANLPVDVIFATGSVVSAIAAKSATASIPIVFANGSDPVQYGLVASLARPEGNATGVTFFADTLMAKRFELMRELVPQRHRNRRAHKSDECRCAGPATRSASGGARGEAGAFRPQREHAKRDRRCLCGTCQTSGRCTSCRRRSNVRELAGANRLPGGQLRHSRDV